MDFAAVNFSECPGADQASCLLHDGVGAVGQGQHQQFVLRVRMLHQTSKVFRTHASRLFRKDMATCVQSGGDHGRSRRTFDRDERQCGIFPSKQVCRGRIGLAHFFPQQSVGEIKCPAAGISDADCRDLIGLRQRLQVEVDVGSARLRDQSNVDLARHGPLLPELARPYMVVELRCTGDPASISYSSRSNFCVADLA